MTASKGRLLITGAAGLLGQNLVARARSRGWTDIIAIDKHPANTATLRALHPDITVVQADLAHDDGWQHLLDGIDALVIGQAQIGGLDWAEFEDNNILASRRIVAAAEAAGVPYTVSISSSVVNSAAVDFYTESKKAQEKLVDASALAHITLRPTLMFGWFDRKHLGWLARFMAKVPVFPVPGSGRFLRQPLYVGDFCEIILAAIDHRMTGTYNISGQERIDYIDLMRAVKKATGARAAIIRIPYGLFHLMLSAYALVDKNPPFTTRQLAALVTPDVFEVIDWPGTFGVTATALDKALDETFNTKPYSDVVLAF